MLVEVFLLSLINIQLTYSATCPDGEEAFFQCNQATKICEDDPELSCLSVEGTYYCCSQNKMGSTTKPAEDQQKDDETCKDNNETECDSVKEYCKDADSIDMMKAECAKTCGFCGNGNNGASSKSPQCQDKMKQCSIWKKYGFCETDKVTGTKKKEVCPQTCGLC